MKTQSAESLYAERLAGTKALIEALAAQLMHHEAAAKANPKNYGYAGDLLHVEIDLKELVRILDGDV